MKKLLFPTMVFCMFLCSFASAQTVKSRGIGRVSYSCPPNPKNNDICEPGPNNKEDALQKAILNSIERYFAERGEAETENYDRNEDVIKDNLERIVLNDTILNEQDKSGRYEVTVSVEINESRLRNIMRGESAVAKTRDSKKSEIVYLFIGRDVGSVTSFDDKTVKQAKASGSATAATAGTESESVKKSTVSTSAVIEGSAAVESRVEIGGSTTRKTNKVTYNLLPMTNYDTSITSVFSQAGFKFIDSRFVLSEENITSVNGDYSQGDDIEPSTYRGVASALQNEGIPYLVLATLDVDRPTVDPATGRSRVAVRTTVKVLDVSSRFPVDVASIPVDQSFGLGATPSEAQSDALNKGSQHAAREIVQRLNALDVR
jgi:hypothetical protein